MEEQYVIATRYDGRLVCGFKRVKVQFERNAYWEDPVFAYPNKKKPVFFKSREKAEKMRHEMPLNQGTYVRKAKPREIQRWIA